MRLCIRAGPACVLPVLVLLAVLYVQAEQSPPRERHYYIAAVQIDWNYNGPYESGPTYKKVVFREYEKGFSQAKTHPARLGLLGPTLAGEEGETIVVTFRNMADIPCSIHPHGIAYGKQSEGAHYFDNTSQKEKEDDIVQPNQEHVYYWEVTADITPQKNDPSCLTYTYISHQNVVQDYNSGLIGTLLICKPGSLNELGEQNHFHHVFLFGVFDEKVSWYKPNSHAADNHVKYTINGYTNGSLPDVSVCAHTSVNLHLMGMSSEPELFSVHMNGHVLQQTGHKVASVGLISGSTATASMIPVGKGRWLLSSCTTKHLEVGMHGFVEVRKCDGFEAPSRRMTIAQQRKSTHWKFYIAAEEITWDYAPEVPAYIDEDFKFQYLRQSSNRIGKKYKKAVYTWYKNDLFKERAETAQRKAELGILGPVIRAQVRDIITVVFKNMASRPYSIYPHGLTIQKSDEGVNYPAGGNQSHGVQPGETRTYVWKVLEEDVPLEEDSRCLTRMYYSAVDAPRDIASGLVGPILICKSESLNVRNVQRKADKEQHAMFAVFDENKSWYLDENIQQYTDPSKVNKEDPNFYKSNVMHTINGHVFESVPTLGFCNGEIATWHVSSIGAQDYIQTATFYGHPFQLNDRTEDYLSLYPMTGETITMNMDNIGIWLLATLNSHETTKGMRIKFQDVECFRDYQYEYNDYEGENTDFSIWKPQSLDDIKKEEEKTKVAEPKKQEIDLYTEQYIDELGLRSSKKQSPNSDMEKLDLSFLDYDFVDVPDGDTNITPNISFTSNETNILNGISTPKGKNIQKYKNLTEISSSPPVVSNPNEIAVPKRNENTAVYNVTLSLMVNIVMTETNKVPGPGNLSSTVEAERMKEIQTGENQTSVSVIQADESAEKITRGDVFSYISHPNITDHHDKPERNISVTPLTNSVNAEAVNNTATKHVNMSTDLTNKPQCIPKSDHREFNVSRVENRNQTISELKVECKTNTTIVSDSVSNATKQEDDHQMNASGVTATPNNSTPDILKFVNLMHILLKNVTLKNVTVSITGSDPSAEISSDSQESVTGSSQLNHRSSLDNVSNGTTISGNLSLTSNPTASSSSQELSDSDSSEEILIYLKENNTEVIQTTSLNIQGHNWTYDGIHQTVTREIPDDMMKYFAKETPQTTPAPKKTPKIRKVNRRQWPQRGQGMKTKRKKEYKPQSRSSLPFSPRGFNPGMSPRGARPLFNKPKPISDEEELINVPVVIGVPRLDFSDYELYVPGNEPDHLNPEDIKADEYEYVTYKDPYSSHDDIKDLTLDEMTKYYLKISGPNTKTYFIAAEEVEWDYAGYGQRRQEKPAQNGRETKFTKVVFRGYMDGTFRTPDVRGEVEEHLGILGPAIKAEVGQSIMVVFRNKANRPYSLHPNGVSYTKQSEGLAYEDESKYWFKYDNEVQPNSSFTYVWKVSDKVGPMPGESQCRTWAYYSGVNPERDIHSGLIGPLLVCRKDTLDKMLVNSRDFMLLLMTFDESQSWYYEKNLEMIKRKNRRTVVDQQFKEKLKFHSINGIIYSLKGLRMYTNQLVRWHLINMGSPRDFQSVHFHGQTFLHKKSTSYRQAIHPLLPGSFATLEMLPSKPGLWQLETEVGFSQQKGMQTLFLVLDNECYHPLGLQSGSVKDEQITAIKTRSYWEPHLARLNNHGKYNAWSTEHNDSWIQVDFMRPVVISQVATQGAKQMFYSQYVINYSISYSTDRRKWVFYKGDSIDFRKTFTGNQEAYETKRNTFFPPLIGRFIRLHPLSWYNKATVRMEFYGCELDGCSVPLGMENGMIADRDITASSTASTWYSGPWKPYLARLNRQGTVNAWQAKNNDMNQWLQVELPQVKKITGIVTQGAKSLGKEMYVISYGLQYSQDGTHWTWYTDDEDYVSKTFIGNTNNNDHVKNYIYPPIFSRFIRIIPISWKGSITMRVELLGCDFE